MPKLINLLSVFKPLLAEQGEELVLTSNKYLLFSSIISAAYIVPALLGFQFATVNENVTLIWIPSGIALAAILHY